MKDINKLVNLNVSWKISSLLKNTSAAFFQSFYTYVTVGVSYASYILNSTSSVRSVFRALSNVYDGAFCEYS